jgi:hypothetical protein
MGRESTTPNTWEEAYPAAVGVEIGEIGLEGKASSVSPAVTGRRRAASRRPSLGVAVQTRWPSSGRLAGRHQASLCCVGTGTSRAAVGLAERGRAPALGCSGRECRHGWSYQGRGNFGLI